MRIKSVNIIKSFVIIAFLFAGSALAEADLRIIAHDSFDRQVISARELRAIFSLNLVRWRSGVPIRLFVMEADTPSHALFCKNMLRVFPHQLQAAWDRATYTGTGLAPVRVRNYDEMVRMVAQTPGAIGYISNEFDVTGNEERVRFIEVE